MDAIIVSTITGDQPLPSTAAVVADALGARQAWPLDLTQAACAGGVHGLILATHLLQNPALDTVLVIGAETLSRITDPRDRTTRVFFGDAAGAALLRRAAPGYGLLAWDVGYALSYSVGITAGGSRRPLTPKRVAAGEQFPGLRGGGHRLTRPAAPWYTPRWSKRSPPTSPASTWPTTTAPSPPANTPASWSGGPRTGCARCSAPPGATSSLAPT